MGISAIYNELRANFGLSGKRNSVDMNRNGTVDPGETLTDPAATKAFLKALIEKDNNIIDLKMAYDAVNANNDHTDDVMNMLESYIVTKACLLASGVPESELMLYLQKLEILHTAYLNYKDKKGVRVSSPGDDLRYLHHFLWLYGGKRYGDAYRLNEVIDNQTRYFNRSGAGGTVGNCSGLATLFTVLGIRLGLDVTFISTPKHVHIKVAGIELESTSPSGIPKPSVPWRYEFSEFACVSDSLINNAGHLELKGDHKGAIDLFKVAMKINPKDSEIFVNISVAYNSIGKTALAHEALKRSLELNPKNAEALNNLGGFYFQSGKYTEARDTYLKVIKLDPEKAETYKDLAFVYQSLKEYERANHYYGEAIKHGLQTANMYINMGINIALLGGDLHASIGYLQEAIKLDPKHVLAWTSMGVAYGKLANYPRAKECFRKALDINGRDPEAWFNLGTLYGRNKEYAKAEKCLEQAVKFNPKYAKAYMNLGIIYKADGKYDKANECFRKAKELSQ